MRRSFELCAFAYSVGLFTAVLANAHCCRAGSSAELAERLKSLDARVVDADSELSKQLPQMLSAHVRARRTAANARETLAWRELQSRELWERYRDVRIAALRRSLGEYPPVPSDLQVQIIETIEGDGYRIDNVAFESRPGLIVTANLYRPETARESMPGILLCHSHHNPKTESELQDMGMNWARLGCLVLVTDQVGHGERRQHPFVDERSYSGSFRPTRQDYYFRYNVGMQLHLIGDSLIGWMAWDLMRGVDLLLAQKGIDPKRMILLGSVAGGGDPTAVAGAIDPRITAVVPFNFGGPQPETTFPLPADGEMAFNYAGGGSWESTRNLQLSARDGFLPWVIVGGAAPRRLIYAHEFAWDREHDPVWTRLQKVYAWYGVPDFLDSTHGRGSVSGKPPEATHCNNIGAEHRKQIHAAFERWFGIPVPDPEFRDRRDKSQLLVLGGDKAASIEMRPVHQLAGEIAAQRGAVARSRQSTSFENARDRLREEWAKLLGDVQPKSEAKVASRDAKVESGVNIERIVLEVEPGIVVPLVLLMPQIAASGRVPVVIGVSQEGKQRLLSERSKLVANVVAGGMAVCLPDVRGTGETRLSDGGRGRQTSATSISSSELMLGQTLVGSRLRDLRSVLDFLCNRKELDPDHVAVWGDSLAPPNAAESKLMVPLDAESLPEQSEPLGGLLALFAALYDDRVSAVYAHAGLVGYQAVLENQFCWLPHDVIVPGALTAGDLNDVAAALAPRALWLAGPVDGGNRKVLAERLGRDYSLAQSRYRAADAAAKLQLTASDPTPEQAADWLQAAIKGR